MYVNSSVFISLAERQDRDAERIDWRRVDCIRNSCRGRALERDNYKNIKYSCIVLYPDFGICKYAWHHWTKTIMSLNIDFV